MKHLLSRLSLSRVVAPAAQRALGLVRAVDSAKVATKEVEATVRALVPQYHQVKVQTKDGHLYSITRHTQGVNWGDLHEGQKVVCVVTRKLPRVLTARIVA